MGKEVKLRLIFANADTSHEFCTNMSNTVSELKRSILDPSCWPPSLDSCENVERIRLFAGGKEIGGRQEDEGKSLEAMFTDAKLRVNQNGPTAVHVYPSMRSTEVTEKEGSKPLQCFCAVL